MDKVVVHNHALYSRSNQHGQFRDLLTTTLFVRALSYTPTTNLRNLEGTLETHVFRVTCSND